MSDTSNPAGRTLMNPKSIAKLLMLLIALTTSIGAKAANLFESRLDYVREPENLGLYEQAKLMIDERIRNLNKFEHLKVSAFEKEHCYFVRKDCGISRSEKALFARDDQEILFDGLKWGINSNWREALERKFSIETGIVPNTNMPNAMLQSACYISKKLGEMAKDGYSYQIQIEHAKPYYLLKIIERGPQDQKSYSLLRTSDHHQLIELLDGKNADQSVKQYSCNHEQNKSFFSPKDKKEQMDFPRFRQELYMHLTHTMPQHFNIKFFSSSKSVAQQNPKPVIEQKNANSEKNADEAMLKESNSIDTPTQSDSALGTDAANDPEENQVLLFLNKLKFW